MTLISQRMAMSSHNGKFFRNRDFRFKIRFRPLWIDYDQKNFFDQKFLSLPFFRPKMAKIRDFLKDSWSKIFLIGIDSEWSETYFKTKISISKKISILTCHSHFFEKLVHKSKKLQRQKISVENLFGRIRFRLVQNVL